MPADVVTMVEQFIQKLLGDPSTAAQYVADPKGTLAANGLTEHSLDGVDVRQVVGQACTHLPAHTGAELASYVSGGTPMHGGYTPPAAAGYEHQSVEQVMQHLNYVTYVTYKDNHSITETLTHTTSIDDSTHLSVNGPNSGDIAVDNANANATGDGAVAGTGDAQVTAATGSHSQAIGGSNLGQANTGDGAVQVGGDADHSPINTGTSTGVMAGGGVQGVVVGDHNQTVQAGSGGASNSVIDFGNGHVSNASGNAVSGGGAVSSGGDAHNVSGNTVDHGSALATDGSAATGHDTTTTTTHIVLEPEPLHHVLDHEGDPGHLGHLGELGTEFGGDHYAAPAQVLEPVQHDAVPVVEHH